MNVKSLVLLLLVVPSVAFNKYSPSLGLPHRPKRTFSSRFTFTKPRNSCSSVSKLYETRINREPNEKSTKSKNVVSKAKLLTKKHGNSLKKSSGPQTWRIFGINVHPDMLVDYNDNLSKDLPLDKRYLVPPVLSALYQRLKLKHDGDALPQQLTHVRVVRRSLDARQKRRGDSSDESGPRFTYVLDIGVKSGVDLRLKEQPGRSEMMSTKSDGITERDTSSHSNNNSNKTVIIVGAGPAGLFCALTLARQGLRPILLERGQAVESRGKHIGALMHRSLLNKESNFAFGEGGAGTWSDGKLTTRIGRNSDSVRFVLETFVEYGAPATVLIEGAPHLGTDNLVRLLRNMRQDLRDLGGTIYFGAKMTSLIIEHGVAKGVNVTFSEAIERGTNLPSDQFQIGDKTILGDAVVMATGHSARDVYENLHTSGVKLEAKGFAAGFRVEHPQRLINDIQYGSEWGPSVHTGKKGTDEANQDYFLTGVQHSGKLPVPSYRLATDKAFDGTKNRGAYSFCMCPGGQIVPASTDPNEVCVNGMSFSKRDSQWANSALVVTVAPDDEVLEPYRAEHGILAGLAFQRDMEQRASIMGGGKLIVPVQRLTDFINGVASTSAPSSSYRLGVKPAACHEIYPAPMVASLRDALVNYIDKTMPGYVCDEGLLHAVETRTSSPVRISRDNDTLQAIGIARLFPAGEGAGFAGGIVSAAVDGLVVAEAVIEQLRDKEQGQIRKTSKKEAVGFSY